MFGLDKVLNLDTITRLASAVATGGWSELLSLAKDFATNLIQNSDLPAPAKDILQAAYDRGIDS